MRFESSLHLIIWQRILKPLFLIKLFYVLRVIKDSVYIMTKFINCTPHAIVLNDGRVFDPSGSVARVSSSTTDFTDDVCRTVYGDLTGVPDAVDGVKYIVSAMVLNASTRTDLVAPATGHVDTVRNDKGHIVSVPGFTR